MRCLGFCLGTQAAAYPAGRKLHRRKSWLSCWARSRPSTYATPFLRLRAGQQGPRSASHSGLPRPPRFPTHSALHTDGGAPVRPSVVAGSCSGCEKEEGRRAVARCECLGLFQETGRWNPIRTATCSREGALTIQLLSDFYIVLESYAERLHTSPYVKRREGVSGQDVRIGACCVHRPGE